MLISALRFTLGAAAGVAIWWYGTPAYNVSLARAAEPVIRIDSRLRNTFVVAAGRSVSISGADLPVVRLPADQLTYNVILFCGLFATLPLWRRRTAIAFVICSASIAVTHVLAVAASAEATFAARSGAWSPAHYSALEQDVWTAIEYLYRLAGMFGIAFGCWWTAKASPQ